MRAETIKSEIIRMVRQVPFKPFIMSLENGDRIPVGHPENIAFDPNPKEKGGSFYYYVIARDVRHYGTFDSVTSVATVDSVEELV